MTATRHRQSTALVVEDDPWLRQLMVEVVNAKGFAVLEASNGHTALRTAERDQPDLILLDIALPEMSGAELLRELKRTALTEPRVIVVSANPEQLSAEDASQVDGVLRKPFELAELAAQIDRTAAALSAQGAFEPIGGTERYQFYSGR